jgi:NADPH:quinone reductase-like Zn-dependent oxidoreductase
VIRVRRSAVIDAPIERVWAVLRDFNSHSAWHPAVGPSAIENGEPSDQVGCVRAFTLKDGNQIREQLLALSDRDHVSTYCILDATLPMRNYVATVQLKRVTDGDRTFWHWESTFDVPRGREREFEQLVGGGVYEAGFAALAEYVRADGRLSSRATAAASVTSVDSRGVVATSFGGPEVLQARRLDAPAPASGEVRLRQTAIGVNYIDVYIRTGLYRMIEPPAPIGMEAAGIVLESRAAGFNPGDRVAYACTPPGAYVTMRTLAANQLVLLPDHVSDEAAAALMLKGMTAEYLLHRTHRVKPGDTVLVHAAAGGVGLLLCQWAQALGARVIGTVSTEAKAELARTNGCQHPIVTRSYSFAEKTRQLSGGRGADVIYDGLGQDATAENLAALAMRGHWVSYGHATGALEPPNLSGKSGTLSQPVLFHYTEDHLQQMAGRVFAAERDGILRPDVRHRYPLAAAADAHRDLEARRTSGQIVLLP